MYYGLIFILYTVLVSLKDIEEALKVTVPTSWAAKSFASSADRDEGKGDSDLSPLAAGLSKLTSLFQRGIEDLGEASEAGTAHNDKPFYYGTGNISGSSPDGGVFPGGVNDSHENDIEDDEDSSDIDDLDDD